LQGDMTKHFGTIKQDILNTGIAENVALSDHPIIYGGNNTDGLTWASKTPGARILISWRDVSPEFISTSGMKILEGRDFQMTDSTDVDHPPKNINVLITESMAKLMGKGSAIGKTIKDESGTINANVVGVVKDYVYGYMYGKPDPVIFFCIPDRMESIMYVHIKRLSDPEQSLAKLEVVMKKNNPAYPFQYKFVDDQFDQMFLSEMLISKLTRVFAALAIVISCLGLFGLAAYTAERRIKEIGIRKVLGASVSGITALLSKDFLKLVMTSCVVAFPIAWLSMNNWLKNYPYRINISWSIFLIAGLLAMLIALVTISFQSVRAALMNPVKSMRSE
ncbi:MAG TPA: FtsX-like permease family protein, partial [Puia sp.]|nr:FtsX-like permease family protein [Puia sp.]